METLPNYKLPKQQILYRVDSNRSKSNNIYKLHLSIRSDITLVHPCFEVPLGDLIGLNNIHNTTPTAVRISILSVKE